MKFSESWLREWVNPSLTREKLCTALTMAGLEVEELAPVAKDFSGIVVGQVLKTEKHPEADRLKICEVNVGSVSILKIVCGADNVRPGLKVPVAMIDAVLPNKTVITPATIRGVASQGMLCSASELELSDESQGLLELPENAPIGEDLKTYLKLNDYVIELSITPNRGDCLSIKGIAREVSALTRSPLLKTNDIPEVHSTFNVIHVVSVEAKTDCPAYIGRILRNVKADAVTPVWLKECLNRSGIRSISPVVDITNYVMLELGQPMHAFDLEKVKQGIHVRKAKYGEKIKLLDDSEKVLDAETLVIADAEKPLAIAGVMGGLDSSVTATTKDIFLESAFFTPQIVARQRQHYGLSSDSAYRFERGVDPTIQRQAIERATQLIIEIAGGDVGPVIEIIHAEHLPKKKNIVLPHEKIAKVLGMEVSEKEVKDIFTALNFVFSYTDNNWVVQVPAYRFDITLPEDLIEEVARLYGYDRIPTRKLKAELHVAHADEGAADLQPLRQMLSDEGYNEIISYSFVDSKLQKLLSPDEVPCELVNPITADMTVMRTNLWPGLMNTLMYNKSRQQHRIHLFEIGTCFVKKGKNLIQEQRLGGVMMGLVNPEQWGIPGREADFYDLKGHVERILHFLRLDNITFKPEAHPCLHPGQCAGIYYENHKIGVMGALHPGVLQDLDISERIFVYEIGINNIKAAKSKHSHEVSKFPEIRRDIAILVNQAIPAREIQDTIKVIAGDWLKDIFIFDVYQGKGISPGLKSIALALVLQHPVRTLVDDEVTALMERIIQTLKGSLGAELRR